MSIIQNRSQPPFVMLYIGLLRSDEFKQLSNSAKVLYLYLRAAYNPKHEEINIKSGEIQVRLTYTEIEKINGFSSKTISRCIKELIEANLIEKSEQGGLMNNKNAYSFKGKYKNFPNQISKKKNTR